MIKKRLWRARGTGAEKVQRLLRVDPVMTWIKSAHPEVARVGLNELEAKERGIPHEVTVYGIGLNKVLDTIHIYPTLAEANKYVAGNWKRAHAPAGLLRWSERYLWPKAVHIDRVHREYVGNVSYTQIKIQSPR